MASIAPWRTRPIYPRSHQADCHSRCAVRFQHMCQRAHSARADESNGAQQHGGDALLPLPQLVADLIRRPSIVEGSVEPITV